MGRMTAGKQIMSHGGRVGKGSKPRKIKKI